MTLRSRRFVNITPDHPIIVRFEESLPSRASAPSHSDPLGRKNLEIPTPNSELVSDPIQIPFAKPSNLIRQNLSTFMTANKVAESYDADSEDERLFGEMEIRTFEEKFGLLNRKRPTCSSEACSVLNCQNWEAIYDHWKKKKHQTKTEAIFPANTIRKNSDSHPYLCFRPLDKPPISGRRSSASKRFLEKQIEYERKRVIYDKALQQRKYLIEKRSMLEKRITDYKEEMFEIRSDFRHFKQRKRISDMKENKAKNNSKKINLSGFNLITTSNYTQYTFKLRYRYLFFTFSISYKGSF